MTGRPSAILPVWNRTLGASATLTQIDGWLRHPALRKIADATHVNLPAADDPHYRQGLRDAVRTAWDFRRGSERDRAETVTFPKQEPVELDLVAAPTYRDGAQRANTRDAFEFWAQRMRGPGMDSALVITNPIYVPYQGVVAMENLGYHHDMTVETVGADDAASELGDETQQFTVQQYLQEMQSTISAMVEAREAIGRVA